VGDAGFVVAGDPMGVCCLLASPYRRRHAMDGERTFALQLVAAHIAAGFRLRRDPVRTEAVTPEGVEAVLDPDGKVHHAEGAAAASAELRERLRDAARGVFAARGEVRRRDPLRALILWRALVSGRWSLVDRFDSDGRRFVLACHNRPGVRGHRQLTPREAQVATLAALGHPNKVIAYELGIAPSSASTLLTRALRRLNVASRSELVALFAGTLP
jgi:DNA-binding CsgD family transcriptional regulator